MKKETRLQFPMFGANTDWTPPTDLPDLSDAKEIAIDLETRDPNLKTKGPGWPTGDGEVVGVAIATSDWKGYLPFSHLGGGNLDRRIISRWLTKILAGDGDKIMHNAQYDAGWLRQMDVPINGRIVDTMITASLLDENRFSYSLNALSFDYLGKTKSEKLLTEAARDFGVDPKAEMWKLPAPYVGPYAEMDAELTLELWQLFKTQIAVEDLSSVWDLETSLLPCLIDMTWRGVRVDLDKAERTKQVILKREKGALAQIKKMAGFEVEVWAAASLKKAFDKIGIKYPRTEKGAPSFTKAFLTEHQHEFPRLVVKARELNKIQGTFINAILKHVGKDGRIHSHINQLRSDNGGTVSGRISMNNPNLQQIPARDPELGPMIRSLFLPEEGEQWAAIDFSQQEPRILVHYASVLSDWKGGGLEGVDEFVDGYTNNPDMDFHTMVAKMADIPRKSAKTINLAMMYGMGVTKLSHQLDISLDEAKDLTKQYHSRVPFVKQLMQGVSRRLEDARSNGSVRSLKGRKCRFDLWEPKGFEMKKALPKEEALATYGQTTQLKRAFTYKALNRLIQASAADMTKQAMVNLYNQGVTPLLQIHDELDCSVKDLKEAKKISGIMETALDLKVPSKCDIDLGPSWGEAKEVKSV
jgi:DNA polymerase I-like protein with 3'-5' exonuclease and polymerase domains